MSVFGLFAVMLVAYGWNESVRFHEWRLSLVPALACQPPQDNMAAVGRWVDGQLVPPGMD